MQIAERVYSLAQEQDDPTLMIWAYNSLAVTLYYLGDFEASGQNAMRGVRIWRSGNVQSDPEDVDTPVVSCLWHVAASEWHLGEIASSQATVAEAVDEPATAAAFIGIGGKIRCSDFRRRLRQRISVFGAPHARIARTRPGRPRALCRNFRQNAVSVAPAGIFGRTNGFSICFPERKSRNESACAITRPSRDL